MPLTVSSWGVVLQPPFQLAPGKTGLFLPEGGLLLDASHLPAPNFEELQNFRQAARIELTLDGVVFATGQFVCKLRPLLPNPAPLGLLLYAWAQRFAALPVLQLYR